MTKNREVITQLTASGTSTTETVAGVGPSVTLRHANGTGTITAAATAQIEYQLTGGSAWFAPPTTKAVFGLTASTTEDRWYALPDAASSVRIVYVAPTGSTGHTLDAEVGSVTP